MVGRRELHMAGALGDAAPASSRAPVAVAAVQPRLNVYAGLAAVFFLREVFEMNLPIPMDEFDWPLMLQDKTFKPDGQLLDNLNKVDGDDTAVVNGKAYPYLAVGPNRFRILDASNSRFWRLRLDIRHST
jgi:spore coat protein A